MLGAKSADDVIFSAPDKVLFYSAPSDEEAETATGFTWATLAGAGMDLTYGANLLLPSDEQQKEALIGTSSSRTKSIYAEYENIGTYDGKIIDLKIYLIDYENYVDWKNNKISMGVLGFWVTENTSDNEETNIYPGISVCGLSWVQLLYEFHDHQTGENANVKGSTSFYDVDYGQSVHIRAGDTKLKGIYVTDVNSSVPDLDLVNSLTTRVDQRNYFANWTPNDCVLKFSDNPPQGTGVVVYSSHGNDNATDSEQYGDTKHAFTITFERNNINIVYSCDKGIMALNSNATAGDLRYTRNSNGGFIHSSIPVYTGSLEIRKEVTGEIIDPEKEFTFQIDFFKRAGDSEPDGSLDGTFGNVPLVDGVGTFTLKHGESVTITGVPIRENGTPYKVTELTTDGYFVEVSAGVPLSDGSIETLQTLSQSQYASAIRIDSAYQVIAFENYGGAVLPNTGGAGNSLFTASGIGLICFSSVCLIANKPRKKAPPEIPHKQVNQHRKEPSL